MTQTFAVGDRVVCTCTPDENRFYAGRRGVVYHTPTDLNPNIWGVRLDGAVYVGKSCAAVLAEWLAPETRAPHEKARRPMQDSDNSTLNVFDCFAGGGGMSLGLEMTNVSGMLKRFQTVGFCEKAAYPRRVLRKHWGDTIPLFEDIADVTEESVRQAGITRIDVLTAGFPCQPFSDAGNKNGIEDERFLWGELIRVVAEIKPRFLLFENVPGLLTTQNGLVFGGILYDLARVGYAAEWHHFPAAALGAAHQRDRVWILGYPDGIGQYRTGDNLGSGGDHPNGNDTFHKFGGGAILPQITSASETVGNANSAGHNTQQRRVSESTNATNRAAGQQRQYLRRSPDRSGTVGNAAGTRLQGQSISEMEESVQLAPTSEGECGGGRNGIAEPSVGRITDGLSSWVDRYRLTPVALQGMEQFAHEPPRTLPKDEISNRAARLSLLGNAVVPQIVAVWGECIWSFWQRLQAANAPTSRHTSDSSRPLPPPEPSIPNGLLRVRPQHIKGYRLVLARDNWRIHLCHEQTRWKSEKFGWKRTSAGYVRQL